MRTRVVPASDLKRAQREEWVDKNRRAYVKSGTAWIPVKDGYQYDCELEEKCAYSGPGYQMTGDIALIHGKRPAREDIEKLAEWKKPSCILYIKGYCGIKRIPDAEVLYGEPKEVLHRENGLFFILDPSKVMFAMGNRIEKMRMASFAKKDERIADMFAGIGYFTIPAAAQGACVHAMEINPQSFNYLKRNIEKNNLSKRVFAECGDCRTLLKGEYDRAFMGHFNSVSMIPDVLVHMKKNSSLHVHTISPACEEIEKACRDGGFEPSITVHRVKKYAPHKWHVVQDVILT